MTPHVKYAENIQLAVFFLIVELRNLHELYALDEVSDSILNDLAKVVDQLNVVLSVDMPPRQIGALVVAWSAKRKAVVLGDGGAGSGGPKTMNSLDEKHAALAHSYLYQNHLCGPDPRSDPVGAAQFVCPLGKGHHFKPHDAGKKSAVGD